jgi:hypothetical protein
MYVRVVTLKYDEGLDGFAEDALRKACAGNYHGQEGAEKLEQDIRL